VTADPASLRLFVDESALGLGKPLAITRHDVIHTGHPLIPQAPLVALDREWIPAIGKRGLAVISRDKRIRTKPAEVALPGKHSMRLLDRRQTRPRHWDYLVRVIRRWDDIERILNNNGAGPSFFAINENTIGQLTL
jgi:hypothetical protein